MRIARLLTIGLLAAFLAACASSNSGSVYSRDEARKVQTVKTGVIESVRQVKLEGTKSPVGTIAGGAVGGIAGNSIGGDGASGAIGAVIGAVIGGLAGAATEEGVTRKDGVELTIKLDGGGLISIVQEADEVFTAGENVRILESDGVSRVSH